MNSPAQNASHAGISITWDDLSSFHAQHFASNAQAAKTSDDMHLAEDDLGYYDDGVERTLTDEQIAIFRHSELQELLRAHRLQQEHEEFLGISNSAEPSPTLQKDAVRTASKSENEPAKVSASESARQTAGDLEQSGKRSKKRQKRIYKPEKQDKQQFMGTNDERTFRRACREADEVKDDSIELDY